MIRRPPRSTQSRSSAASDVYKRQFDRHRQFLRRRSPCVQNHGVPSATVKNPRLFLLRVNTTADGSASIAARRTSSAGCGARTRRPRHDKLLRKFRVQAPLRAGPAQLVLRTILLGEMPRDLQAAAGAQPGLLEMALQMPRTVGRGKTLIQLRGGADTQGAIMTTVQAMLVGAILALSLIHI